jgi:hypothetical protein
MIGARASQPGEANRYFRSVEDHFVRLRGAPLVLSPDDWHLAASWLERRIPLQVVLRAISEVFETARTRKRRRPVLSLSYCRHAVEEAYVLHLQSAVGEARAEPGRARRRPLVERLAEWERLTDTWGPEARLEGLELLEKAEEVLAGLEAGRCGAESAETRLSELEHGLLDVAARSLPPSEHDHLVAECERRLADYRDRMTAEVYARTRQRALAGELRRRLGLPRLSLLID